MQQATYEPAVTCDRQTTNNKKICSCNPASHSQVATHSNCFSTTPAKRKPKMGETLKRLKMGIVKTVQARKVSRSAGVAGIQVDHWPGVVNGVGGIDRSAHVDTQGLAGHPLLNPLRPRLYLDPVAQSQMLGKL